MRQFDITSSRNPRIQSVVLLNKRRERERTKRFAIEGTREIALALRGGVPLEEAFVHPPLADGIEERAVLDEIASRGVQTVSVSRKVFARIAYRETSGGIVAIGRTPSFSLADLPRVDVPLYLVIDRVEKPGKARPFTGDPRRREIIDNLIES